MSRANSFFNCYIQLGIQISLFSRSVSKTMAALFVSICQRSSSEEKKKRARGTCACRLKPSIPKPQCFPQQIRNTRTCALFHFCVAPACFLILICEEAILFSLSNPPLPQTQGAPDFCEVTVGKYAYGQGEPQLCEVDCRLISLATLAATVISRIICKIG